MDFVILDDYWKPEPELVEGYTSLIWSERFQSHGEFELKTYDVDRFVDLLPEDTFVSHLESREVMMVETHSIELVGEGADAQDELTIRGRSATKVFEDRWVEAAYGKKRPMRRNYTPVTAACVLMWNVVDNTSGADVTRGDSDSETPGVKNDYPWDTKGVLDRVAITDSVPGAMDGDDWILEQGILYPQLMDILIEADLGLRCVRPVTPNPGNVVSVQTELKITAGNTVTERGTPIRNNNPDISALRFDVYSGTDRSGEVKLSQLQGHLDKPQYLTSVQGHKTMVEMMSSVNIPDLVLDDQKAGTGWKRRIMGFDAGEPELPTEPTKPKEPRANATAAQRKTYREALDDYNDKWAKWDLKRDAIVAKFKARQTKAALRELKKARRVNMFAGDISDLAPYKYRVDYFLGDTITLIGSRGKNAKMIVSEYIRTEDSNGDRGIPGLVAP